MDIDDTLTTMLQEVQSLVDFGSDEIVCGLFTYDGNDAAHLGSTSKMKLDDALWELFAINELDRQKVVRMMGEEDSEFDFRAICKSRWSSRVIVDKKLLFPRTGVREESLWCEKSGGGHCVKVQDSKEGVWV